VLEKEIAVFRTEGITQMISNVVGVHLLLGRVYLGIAMDDYVSCCLFRENFSVDVGDMFMKDNRHVNAAFPCVSLGVFQVYRRNRPIEESFFHIIHDLQLTWEALEIMLYSISIRTHGNEVFLSAPTTDQSIYPVGSKIGDFTPIDMGFCICEDGIKSSDHAAVVKKLF